MKSKWAYLVILFSLSTETGFAAEWTGWLKRFDIDLATQDSTSPEVHSYLVLVTGRNKKGWNQGFVLLPAYEDQRPGRIRTLQKSSTHGLSGLINQRVTVQGEQDAYTGAADPVEFGRFEILDVIFVSTFSGLPETSLKGTLTRISKGVLGVELEDGRTVEIDGVNPLKGFSGAEERLTSQARKDLRRGNFAIEMTGAFQGQRFNANQASVTLRTANSQGAF